MQATSSLNKFIIASLIVHIGLLAGTSFFSLKKQKLIPVEISFGTGNSRGGSGLVKVAATPQAQEQRKVSTPKKVASRIKTDAPKVVSKEEVADEVKNSASAINKNPTAKAGSGKGTTSGTGSGTTSGAGAGFDDPKIRYRGTVRELANSMKKYPRKAYSLHQEGTVMAKLRLSKSGKLLSVEIVDPSSYKVLADATLEAIKAIEKFPEIPNELGLEEITFNLPFEYEIETGDFL